VKEGGMMIKRPYMNDYCEKCKHHYLLDGDESRCRRIKQEMSDMMCVQVVECPYFTERKKVE
jgi:hypothetical protein